MPKSFRCPSCAAPLEIEDLHSAIDRCKFCGSSILISSELNQADEHSRDGVSLQAQKLKEIKQIALSGNKINAIKIYRETFGTGLKEAKDAVDNMTEGKPVELKNATAFNIQNYNSRNIGQTETPALKLTQIYDELRRGNKINAIKIYRKNFNVSLKGAKEAVEQIERDSFSSEFNQFNNQSVFEKTKTGGLPAISIILGAIVLIILILIIIYALN